MCLLVVVKAKHGHVFETFIPKPVIGQVMNLEALRAAAAFAA
jgi:hypothetical protein